MRLHPHPPTQVAIACAAAILALTAATLPARAQQNWPQRSLRILIGTTPGGSPDIIGRMLADKMTGPLGQSISVENNTGGGGMEQVIEGAKTLWEKGPGQVSPFAIPAVSGSMGAAQVSMKYGLTGPVMTQVAACASGVIAFQDALRLIQTGECDVVIAGGSGWDAEAAVGTPAPFDPEAAADAIDELLTVWCTAPTCRRPVGVRPSTSTRPTRPGSGS